MLTALGRCLPGWLVESWLLASLSTDERKWLVERRFQVNLSLAPYAGLAIVIVLPFFAVVDSERIAAHLAHSATLGLSGVLIVASHVVLVVSALLAFTLRHPRAAGNRPLAERLLTLHLLGLISGLLVLAIIAVITRGKFLLLSTLLVATNFVYIVNWKWRGLLNSCAFVFGTLAIFLFLPETSTSRLFAFQEFLTLIGLCVIGGAIVHRDRKIGYLLQHQESLRLVKLQEEINVAAKLQQALLPSPWPATSAFAVQGMMRPAQDIGGDFYDHFAAQDGAVCLVVADVCGKGIAAGLFGMSAKSILRTTALQPAESATANEPAMLVAAANALLHEGNTEMLFVTVVYAQYQPATGILAFVNAGHVQPLLVPHTGVARWLEAPKGRALGVRGQQRYAAATVSLQAGDTVLFITDGITEAMDASFQEFGMERVKAAFESVRCEGPGECVDHLLAAVDAFTGGMAQSDDITCMALCHQPGLAGGIGTG